MPDVHALLGPSSAAMWMACPPSARLGEKIKDTGSEYAAEGTLAHHVGELLLREKWENMDISEDMAAAQTDPLYSASMLEYMKAYADFVEERMAEAHASCPDPHIFIEQRISFTDYVPHGFGTSDVVIITDGQMEVVDLKYGAGIPVSAEGNPQMRIYGLGAYLAWCWAYDIQRVRMTIYQPRLDSISSDTMTVTDLLEWAEKELKPRAALAWEGKGEFNPGEKQCKWCKAAATCRARAEYQMELAKHDFAPPPTLDESEIADILTRLPEFKAWVKQLEEYAQDAAVNHGVHFPGYKVVEGRSNRKYADEDAIAALLCKAGYQETTIYKPKELLGITAMEKLVGKKKFKELAGKYIIKPEGAPTLVPLSDKRPELNTAAKAAEDFAETGG
ncbi:MAG: DUF2800 domain-containing protein [Acutalibacter muris]|nr:DUF2800 domain-containing protein [Acutalibacter muris]